MSHPSSSDIQFISPLLKYGYPIAVEEYKNGTLFQKPILLYLPGLDGTFLCPFLQFPELGTIFDVRCMTVAPTDRSTFQQLTERTIEYIRQESTTPTKQRPIYLMGESFGGILALHVASQIPQQLAGLALINPATSYPQSKLAQQGPAVAKLPWWQYPAGLLQLLPLFTDDYSFEQLLLILRAQALPSVIDDALREAYLGRVACSLPLVLLTPSTLDWRLHQWLQQGCTATRFVSDIHHLRTLIVVGEKDETLPSVAEAMRLAEIWSNSSSSSSSCCCRIHVVPGAGHASTCGSRVDLAALMRSHFPGVWGKGRTEMKPDAASRQGVWYGMQERYDSAKVGLNPLLYWSSQYYRKHEP